MEKKLTVEDLETAMIEVESKPFDYYITEFYKNMDKLKNNLQTEFDNSIFKYHLYIKPYNEHTIDVLQFNSDEIFNDYLMIPIHISPEGFEYKDDSDFKYKYDIKGEIMQLVKKF